MPQPDTFDAIVIGSGFGGSVVAMRLAEKGYRVLVLERGKRFRDEDFPKTNWNVRRYVWLPALRCFGIMQFTALKRLVVVHGAGVGGGSLVYGNVLMQPDDAVFAAPGWRALQDWQAVLAPHYAAARRMLGVTTSPLLWAADHLLHQVADGLGPGTSFRRTEIGVYFGEPGREGETVPDPYFGGEGPARAGCTHCGACMVGCRTNAKNTLVKNYLYFAEKWGAEIRAEADARLIRPLPPGQPDGARYEVSYRRSTSLLDRRKQRVRARRVVLAAGVLGTLPLLFRCRDEARTLPDLSPTLGQRVRTNSEALLAITARDGRTRYSQGAAITSIAKVDAVTQIEPARFSDGSSFIKLLGAPLIAAEPRVGRRVARVVGAILRHPLDFLRTKLLPGWASRTTILLVMQTHDTLLRLRWGRGLLSLGRRGLVSESDVHHPVTARIPLGYRVTHEFARRAGGVAQAPLHESLFDVPTTAHILGGCVFGHTAAEGVVDLNCEVFNYPGLYVVDASIMPANPGVNPSLTIAALAEYAMSRIPPKAEAEPARAEESSHLRLP